MLSAPIFEEHALSVYHTLSVDGIPGINYEIFANEFLSRRGSFDFEGQLNACLAEFNEIIRDIRADRISIRISVDFEGSKYELPLLDVLRSCVIGKGNHSGEIVGELRIGQKIVHPDYGEGMLEAFVLKAINGWGGNTARFRFSQYEGVEIFIPTLRRVPVFWDTRADVAQIRSKALH